MAASFLVRLWALVATDSDIKNKPLRQKEVELVTRSSHLSAESLKTLKTLLISADLVLFELRLYGLNHPDEFHKLLQKRLRTLRLSSTFDVFAQDIERCQTSARLVALVYNWWSWYCRAAKLGVRLEASISRGLLLASVGWAVSHAGQTTRSLTPMHAAKDKPMALIVNIPGSTSDSSGSDPN
jgi:hypothetical protein